MSEKELIKNLGSEIETIKCVIIGDCEIGKSSLIRSFIYDEFIHHYIPTIKENYKVSKKILDSDGRVVKKFNLEINDTGGLKEFDRLRPLCYSKDIDVFIICFSVINPASYRNVTQKWVQEIKRHSSHKNPCILLVGTQSDLRSNMNILLKLSENELCPVKESRALRLAKKIGAKEYIECSSLTQKNLKYVFENSLKFGIMRRYNDMFQEPKKYQRMMLSEKLGVCNFLDPKLIKLNFQDNNNIIRNYSKSNKNWKLRKEIKLKRLLFLSCFHFRE